MRVLILGGTGFIGSNVARLLVAQGHSVSVLARGETNADLPSSVEVLNADREVPGSLSVLEGRVWDACVDVSGYLPRQVQESGERLRNVQRYVFVSAVAGYGDPPGPVTEDTPTPRLMPAEQEAVQRMDDLDDRTYGPSKVACEDVLRAHFADRLTVLRPQVVTGPGDPTRRFTPWLARAAQHERVLLPGSGADFIQVIDVRDVARFIRLVLEQNLNGTFNLSGPRLPWAEFAGVIGVKKAVWAGLDTLEIPLSDFPLYRPAGSVRSGLMHVSSATAQAAGLTLTAPELTARDTLAALSQAELEALGELPEATRRSLQATE